MSGKHQIGFCALEFSPQGEYRRHPDNSRVIAIVAVLQDGSVSVRVHPQWRSIAAASEHEYLEELFYELQERVEAAPETQMRQLATLNNGPIITRDAGQSLEDSPALLEMFLSFRKP